VRVFLSLEAFEQALALPVPTASSFISREIESTSWRSVTGTASMTN